jgi:protease-4
VAAVRRLRDAKKPVVASLGSVAASGGYYVAVSADRIFASPGTLTGSIGVVMQLANVEGLLKKVGVEYVVVKAGAYKDVGNFARAMTPEERRILQNLLDDVYEQFIAAVAEGRRLEPQAVRGFAEGRIYSGRQAQGLKMVDELGGLEDAIEAAARMAGLPPKPKVVYPRRPFSLRELLRNDLGLGPVSRMLPALETLRTPLYLMP